MKHSQTAHQHLIAAIPKVHEEATIKDVRHLLEKNASLFESIDYIYVVNAMNHLIGTFSIKELFQGSHDRRVRDIMTTELITARVHTDQERIAQLALKHSIKSVPVIDKNDVFLGIIPPDTILEILNQEHTEDLLRIAGFSGAEAQSQNPLQGTVWFHFKKRFPWLFLGLIGGIAAAFVVEQFEGALESFIVLAAFIPAVVYMADAVGSQTQIIFIRTLALNGNINLKTYVLRELLVNCLLAIVLAFSIFGIGSIFLMEPLLAGILGISLFITIIASMLIGLLLPWMFTRFNIDPAIASGPFATVMRDLMSLIIYFIVITIIL